MARKVVLVGCGNMGYAMLKGWLTDALDAENVFVVEPSDALRERAEALGVRVFADAADLVSEITPEIAVLAVKPQIMADVVPAYAQWAGGGTTFLSVAAGVTIESFARQLPGETPIVRCMPNTPAAIGQGMMVCCFNAHVRSDDADFIGALLSSSGRVAFVEDEAQMDAVTAVSGSGPAYVFHFIECLAAAGEREGLPAALAMELAMQTVMGAGALAEQSDDPPGVLRQQVTSPGGTTAAALEVFMTDERLAKLTAQAVKAAADRSRELAG